MTREPQLETVHRAIARLNRLTELFQRRRGELAAAAGFTEQQWLVLERISTEHFIPSLFAEERESSRAAVSKIIRQLVDKGLVTVGLDRQDARQRQYTLTSLGKKKMAEVRRMREEAIDNIWMDFDHGDLTRFCDFSDRLIAMIESYSGKEGS